MSEIRDSDVPSATRPAQAPPPLPPNVLPYSRPETQRGDAFERYQTVAETVGFMPSVRKKDNLIQGIVVAIGTLLGAAIGWYLGDGELSPILILALVGLVVFGILSGIVLMIVGWVRLARKT